MPEAASSSQETVILRWITCTFEDLPPDVQERLRAQGHDGSRPMMVFDDDNDRLYYVNRRASGSHASRPARG